MRTLSHLSLIGCLAFGLLAGSGSVGAAQPKTIAKQAFMIALPSKTVLLAKRADRAMAPSSMAKLMTVLLVLDGLEKGDIALTKPVKISKRAARTRGAKIGLKAGETVRMETLLRGTIVASGNDAAIAIAEALAGSEAAFAKKMTARAQELGLKKSRFRNATGFTLRGQRMSARDVANLSAYLINQYPLYYTYFSLRSMTHKGKKFGNRNPVLGAVTGADGLKTGQTRAGGYGLAASAERGGVRIILVINGLKSARARKKEAVRLLEWGFKKLAKSQKRP